jgi:lipopolysaccharide export system protein LptA
MGSKIKKYLPETIVVAAFVMALALFAVPQKAWCLTSADAEEQKIQLNADKVSYSDNNGIANAEGNVSILNRGMTLNAPFAEYNTKEGTVKAFADSRNNVVLSSSGDRIVGKHLVYNIATKNGVLTDASGRYDAFFVKGRNLKVMPLEQAVKDGLISSRALTRKDIASGDKLIAEWTDVTTTTCDFSLPHYRLVTEEITVIPDVKTVVRHPKVYIGKRMIFRYPFDLIIPMGNAKTRKAAIMPMIGFDSKKGMGLGVNGPVDMGKYGDLSFTAQYWTNGIWEAKFDYDKQITDSLSFFAATERLYNKDTEETLWRPKYGFTYEKNGWSSRLYASDNELVETQIIPGKDSRFNVSRQPEFSVRTPWYSDTVHGWKIRFGGMYGRYKDNYGVRDEWFNRYALGAELYGEPNINISIFKPYYGARYTYYGYSDKNSLTQKVTDAWLGLKWNIGVFDLDTYYFRRWVNGDSPMAWDKYVDNKVLYQTISVPLPFGQSWEKWRFSVRAGYDFVDSKIAEMLYVLTYDKHCITWQLWAKDRRTEGNFETGLSFFIDAYPNSRVTLGTEYNDDKAGFIKKKTDGFFGAVEEDNK